MSDIQLTTLENGLRIITDSISDAHSVALGIWSNVGTRDEERVYNGTAHMVEHMLFKGTSARSAQDIAGVIENVGGNMNAYTSREITSYHIHLLREDMPLALDVLADIYQNSTLPDDEVERERQVIIQEIGMCNDTPDDLVFDNYYEAAYSDQTFGAPILGTTDIIGKMQRDTLNAHITNHYTPENTVISASGYVQHDDFVARVRDAFKNLPANQNHSRNKASYSGGEFRMDKDLEQAHFVLGFEGVARSNDQYYAAQALATILGGGMSSRLFQEVREKRGLVYSVFAFHSGYADTGQFGVYAGTGADKLTEIMPVICDELLKATHDLSDEEVARAKAQLKSGLLMGRESMMTRANQQAKYVLFRDKALDIEAIIKQVDAINRDTLHTVAESILASKPTIAALGPIENLETHDKITARLSA